MIVYLTSFRGVRRTFEECHYVKTVLYNFRVKVDERDIYMNKHFYKELKNRLEEDRSSKLSVPQVFIDGQHIGVSLLSNLQLCAHIVNADLLEHFTNTLLGYMLFYFF